MLLSFGVLCVLKLYLCLLLIQQIPLIEHVFLLPRFLIGTLLLKYSLFILETLLIVGRHNTFILSIKVPLLKLTLIWLLLLLILPLLIPKLLFLVYKINGIINLLGNIPKIKLLILVQLLILFFQKLLLWILLLRYILMLQPLAHLLGL